jgi:hypothetical protein
MKTKFLTALIIYIFYLLFTFLVYGYALLNWNIFSYSNGERVILVIFGFLLGVWFAAMPYFVDFDFFNRSKKY